jgi:hypothetical protein
MKSLSDILGVVAAGALLVTVAGCKRSEPASDADLQKAVQPAQPPGAAKPIAEGAKVATARVEAASAEASSKAQELIDKAKALVDAKNTATRPRFCSSLRA